MWIMPFLVAGLLGHEKPKKGADSEVSQEVGEIGGDAASRLLDSLCDDNTPRDVDQDEEDDPTLSASGEADGATQEKRKIDHKAYRAAFFDTPLHAAVTAMFAEYALLAGRMTRRLKAAVGRPMILWEGASIA